MTYHIVINEKNLSAQTEAAISEYRKRLSPFCKIIVSAAKECPLSGGKHTGKKQKSASSGSPRSFFLRPDVSGTQTVSSEVFADIISEQAGNGASEIQYFIGFPVPDECPQTAICSISGMSLSNEIAAIALTEQIYRSYTIIRHIPYHK